MVSQEGVTNLHFLQIRTKSWGGDYMTFTYA